MDTERMKQFVVDYITFRQMAKDANIQDEQLIVTLYQTLLKEIRDRETASMRINGKSSAVTPPVCPIHKTKMKPSKFGGFYCTAQNNDGSFCKSKVK